MANLPEDFSKSIIKQLGLKDKEEILEKDYSLITRLSVKQNEIKYLNLFPNLDRVTLRSFPSVTDEDLKLLNDMVPNLKSLTIFEQSAIFHINLSIFPRLEEVFILHNENLVTVTGLDRLRIVQLIDNRNFISFNELFKCILKRGYIVLDISYYFRLLRECYINQHNVDLTNRVHWLECSGLRSYKIYDYKKYELEELAHMFNEVASLYLFNGDSELIKFTALYRWYIEHITFENVEEKDNSNNSSYYVFNYGIGSRLSYAKAFQLLLSYIGIESSVVYSLGALEPIGEFNGKKAYSLFGSSDYALLRVRLDNSIYYSDIAWDAYVYSLNEFDDLKAYLLSKEEMKLRHKMIGEGNIEVSCSYHGDDADETIDKIDRRLNDILIFQKDIEMATSAIDGKAVSIEFDQEEIARLTESLESIDHGSTEYQQIQDEIVSLAVEINELSLKIVELKKEKKKVVERYQDFLINNYFTIDIDERFKYGYISKYIYGLLCMLVKK